MFTDNKYTKWYYMIIESAETTGEYSEVHHIIPRCLGGQDTEDNLVKLPYRQHYICHLLLTKMHDSKKLINAFWQMSVKNKTKYYNSNMYAIARRSYVESISGEKHWAKKDDFRQQVSDSWTDDRKVAFNDKVSGDNHWSRRTDMTAQCQKMRDAVSPEARRLNGLKSNFVTNNPMKNPETAKLFKGPKERVICPHCNKEGGKPVMMRYHFDKCRQVK